MAHNACMENLPALARPAPFPALVWVCAWCSPVLDPPLPAGASATHGICEHHLNPLLEQLRQHRQQRRHMQERTMTTPAHNSPDDLLTVFEVLDLLKVSRVTVQKWCREGKLPAVKLGKEYRIRRKDLETWYDRLLAGQPPR